MTSVKTRMIVDFMCQHDWAKGCAYSLQNISGGVGEHRAGSLLSENSLYSVTYTSSLFLIFSLGVKICHIDIHIDAEAFRFQIQFFIPEM